MGCLDRIRRCFGHKVKNEDSIQYSQIDVNTSKLREEEDDEDLAWDDFEDFEESPTEITSYTSNAEHTHDMKNSSKHEHVAIDMNRLQDARAASSSLKSRPKAMAMGTEQNKQEARAAMPDFFSDLQMAPVVKKARTKVIKASAQPRRGGGQGKQREERQGQAERTADSTAFDLGNLLGDEEIEVGTGWGDDDDDDTFGLMASRGKKKRFAVTAIE